MSCRVEILAKKKASGPTCASSFSFSPSPLSIKFTANRYMTLEWLVHQGSYERTHETRMCFSSLSRNLRTRFVWPTFGVNWQTGTRCLAGPET
jgi:hypothetical protein